MGLPSVSLVLATWNGGGYLLEQLATLRAQTMMPKELIVSDDASSDRTMGILEKFAASAPFPVHITRQPERVGYERNFAAAGMRATGDLVMFVDQDDVWHPRKIEQSVTAMATQTTAGLLVHDLLFFQTGSNDVLLPSFFAHLGTLGLPIDVTVHGCALTLRRELIDRWGWPPPGSTISHDCWFCILASATRDSAFLRRRLIYHRIHYHNASGWIPQAEDRVPGLAELLEADGPGPLNGLLEMYVRPPNRGWLATLETALRERATPDQRQAAALAIRKMRIVDGWLEEHARFAPTGEAAEG